MTETPAEAARREIAELYQELGRTFVFSPRRVQIHMQISRLKRQISTLERGA